MAALKKVLVFSDGASRGNPGPAAIAYSIHEESGRRIESSARVIGVATNNEAEYQALLLAMERARTFCRDSAEFYLDSELVVNQVNGQYDARDDRMRDYLLKVRSMARDFKQVRFTYVPRETRHIRAVDAMVNEALDRAG